MKNAQNAQNAQTANVAAANEVPEFYVCNGVKLPNVDQIWADRSKGKRQPGFELFGIE